jgi:hypothetical protein
MAVNKRLFERLVESMGQMDEIAGGTRSPSREFYVDSMKLKDGTIERVRRPPRVVSVSGRDR